MRMRRLEMDLLNTYTNDVLNVISFSFNSGVVLHSALGDAESYWLRAGEWEERRD